MLPQASLNYEHSDFSTSFPRKFTMPTSIRSALFKPFQKCAFLVRLNVSQLNVRFSKVTSFPSTKEVWGLDVCPNAQEIAPLCSQAWLAEPGLAVRTGAVHHERCREVGSYHPEELCPWKGRGLCHSFLARGVSFCEYLCADCWGMRSRTAVTGDLPGSCKPQENEECKQRSYLDTPLTCWDGAGANKSLKTQVEGPVRCFATALPRQWKTRTEPSKLTFLSRPKTIHKQLKSLHTHLPLEAMWL